MGIVLVLGSGRARSEAYKAARLTRTARRRSHTTNGSPRGTKGSSGGTEAPSAKAPGALRRLSYIRGEPYAPTADDDQGTEQLMTLGPDVEVGDDPTNVIRL
ncbi:uncharacterized protein LOC115329390 [Ixodes scapularis]|uniref:uncharacterized protein LOC115329390 n=1 Tax=Ixodes scapularis TaxID=6945 RepID=UPI001C3904F3|nr:uncharacterized protein LOC115329390 [Ixodes scapularis]